MPDPNKEFMAASIKTVEGKMLNSVGGTWKDWIMAILLNVDQRGLAHIFETLNVLVNEGNPLEVTDEFENLAGGGSDEQNPSED